MENQNPDLRNHFSKSKRCVCVLASLATLSTGTILAWPSQITSKLLDNGLGFPITYNQLGWIYSCSPLGAALLSLLIGPISDRLGRKRSMLLLVIPLELGWVLIILSKNVWMLVFGRILTGMVGGAFCVTASLYLGEIARKEIRGLLGGLTQFSIACGILTANILGKFMTVRGLSIICALIPISFLISFAAMPESPLYLQMTGRSLESKLSLRKLLGKKDVEEEHGEIKKTLHSEANNYSYRDVLSKKSVKKALIIGIGLAVVKIFTGVDAITSYLGHILDNTDTSIGPENSAILFAAFQVCSAIFQILIVDKLGRRLLLIVSQLFISLFLLTVAVCLHLNSQESSKALDYIPVMALCLYNVGFSIGIGPIGWLLPAEIFEEKIKGFAMSLCTFLIWFLAFGNVKLFEVVEGNWGVSVPFYVYGSVSFVSLGFIFFLVPETKNKSFSEIEYELSQ
ncbi:hypothetical protein NQ317_002729 [Molorchus minor]|uniref:Major facilitator superfamily (MFS) profile domain-containing protein n=1 Tax=Molorchus minor TaxID=1323400 RepID=A0ABQ9K3H8_9CUCU|nr:hypothetical protein NQ317_002729 [Molorchus minor]